MSFRDRHATVHLKACLFGMRVILSWFLLLLLSMLFLRNCSHRGHFKSFPSVGDICFYDLQRMRGGPFYTSKRESGWPETLTTEVGSTEICTMNRPRFTVLSLVGSFELDFACTCPVFFSPETDVLKIPPWDVSGDLGFSELSHISVQEVDGDDLKLLLVFLLLAYLLRQGSVLTKSSVEQREMSRVALPYHI